MENNNFKLARHVLEKGTYLCGSNLTKIDSATFFIDHIKQKLGVFEKDIKEFVDLLEKLKIIDNVTYVEASTVNEEMTGYAYKCEIDIPKMKKFIERGAGEKTIFDPIKSLLIFGSNEVEILRDTDQFYFCKKMYEYPINEWVSWDIIYDEMQGVKKGANTTKREDKWWRAVYDSMIEINKKARVELKIKKLFEYKKHEFLRTI